MSEKTMEEYIRERALELKKDVDELLDVMGLNRDLMRAGQIAVSLEGNVCQIRWAMSEITGDDQDYYEEAKEIQEITKLILIDPTRVENDKRSR